MPRLLDPGPSRRGWHRLQLVLQCPRKYALYMARKENPEPTSSPALIKGTLLHTALAHRYALRCTWRPDPELLSPLDAIEARAEAEPNAEVWKEHTGLVTKTYLEYELRWAAEQWETVAVEKELQATIRDDERDVGYLYTQRADLIVRNPATGLVYIVDHKTTSRLTSKVMRRYTLSGQFRGYNFFGRGLLGEKFGGVILNMIQWPDRKGAFKFERIDLEPAPFADKTFRDTVVHAERLIHDLRDRHDEPMAWPGAHHETACWTPYGACENHARCEWGTE
jgi:hypothetical protein